MPFLLQLGVDNLIPLELALKITSKITAKERFAVYIVILVWPEGVPSSVSVQEILFWQISHKYSLIYVITKLGLLFVCDLETATAVYRNRISLDPIFLTSEASSAGGFYVINRRGQVLLATINEATIVPFVSGQLNNLELAINLVKRGNLPGAEILVRILYAAFSIFPHNVVVQRFQELFAQTKYKDAAKLAAESPQGILRTPDTVAKFQLHLSKQLIVYEISQWKKCV